VTYWVSKSYISQNGRDAHTEDSAGALAFSRRLAGMFEPLRRKSRLLFRERGKVGYKASFEL
jgi:hypothetical protein